MKKLNILLALILCASMYAKDTKDPKPQSKEMTIEQKAQYDQRATSMHDMLYGKVEAPKKVEKKPEPKKVKPAKKPLKRDEPWISLQHQRNMRSMQLK